MYMEMVSCNGINHPDQEWKQEPSAPNKKKTSNIHLFVHPVDYTKWGLLELALINTLYK